MSNISDVVNTPSTGYTLDNSIGYGAGNWRWEAGYSFENKDFNPNDFGILLAIINSRYMQMVAGELYNQQKTLIDIILIFTIN